MSKFLLGPGLGLGLAHAEASPLHSIPVHPLSLRHNPTIAPIYGFLRRPKSRTSSGNCQPRIESGTEKLKTSNYKLTLKCGIVGTRHQDWLGVSAQEC